MLSTKRATSGHAASKNPKVSVIVPIFNVESFLKRCLDSLARQTLSDIEVILVDDCSTDGSNEIATEYAARHDSWKIIHNEVNRGLSATRNAGIALACGEYIGFVDSDDWVEPTMFETLYKAAVSTDSDISQVQYELCTGPRHKLHRQDDTLRVLTGIEALEEMFLVEKYAPWFMLYKRELLENETGLFPEGLTYEDRVFNSVFLPKAHRVAVSNRVEYYYFQNYGSISQSGLSLRGLDLLEADKLVVSNVEKLQEPRALELARDRAAKGSYSLLIKWIRFGVADSKLNEAETLAILWSDFRVNYPRLMKSQLSLIKKLVAWQLRYCPRLLKLEFAIYHAFALRK